jgi:hypothetical protein
MTWTRIQQIYPHLCSAPPAKRMADQTCVPCAVCTWVEIRHG